MARSSPEKRRAVRKLEARRDDLLVKSKKMAMDLKSTRAALKQVRKQGVS